MENKKTKLKFPIAGFFFLGSLALQIIYNIRNIGLLHDSSSFRTNELLNLLMVLLLIITSFLIGRIKHDKPFAIMSWTIITCSYYLYGYWYHLFNHFSFYDVFLFFATLFFLLCLFAKGRITKKKLLFALSIVSPILLLFVMFFRWVSSGKLFYPFIVGFNHRIISIINIAYSCLFCGGIYFFLNRYFEPYAKDKVQAALKVAAEGEKINAPEEYAEIYCEMAKHILLCIFTFGVWYLIWIYKATKYLNRAPEGEQYDPTNKLLLCLFVPFYQIYWFYKHGQKLDSLMKSRNIDDSDMATLCLILGIFIPIVACILMQDKFNQLCTVTATPAQPKEEAIKTTPTVSTESFAVTDLKQYKELLDSGVITQEEFDAKKKQILGL